MYNRYTNCKAYAYSITTYNFSTMLAKYQTLLWMFHIHIINSIRVNWRTYFANTYISHFLKWYISSSITLALRSCLNNLICLLDIQIAKGTLTQRLRKILEKCTHLKNFKYQILSCAWIGEHILQIPIFLISLRDIYILVDLFSTS